MANLFGNKLGELLGKMDDKMLQTKLSAAVEMLKKGNTEDLAKKLSKMDKSDLLKKMEDFDESKLQDLNLNMDDIKQKVSSSDLDKLSQLIGEQGDDIVKKIKEFINK